MISKEKTIFDFCIEKEKKKILQELAKKDGRSLANLVNHIIDKYIMEVQNDNKTISRTN